MYADAGMILGFGMAFIAWPVLCAALTFGVELIYETIKFFFRKSEETPTPNDAWLYCFWFGNAIGASAAFAWFLIIWTLRGFE